MPVTVIFNKADGNTGSPMTIEFPEASNAGYISISAGSILNVFNRSNQIIACFMACETVGYTITPNEPTAKDTPLKVTAA